MSETAPSERHIDPGQQAQFESQDGQRIKRAWEVLQASAQLGLTSFGGPTAHLGYFERAYVRQRQWLTGEEYSSLVSMCQILPGPASSQVGFLIGLHRAGWLGGFTAWLGFTLPSALLLYACARLSAHIQGPLVHAIFHGLKLVAVAVVAQAVWSMAQRLCLDRQTKVIALVSASLLLCIGGSAIQLLVLAIGALGGVLLCRQSSAMRKNLYIPIHQASAWVALTIFGLLFLTLPVLASQYPHSGFALAEIFYRAGALVFGGGHVVLPLLRDSLVPNGWISDDSFLGGYGLAQAVPGPLFTLAAYLGAANTYTSSPEIGSVIAVVFIFLPGLLIAVAGAALWARIDRYDNIRAGLAGLNAAVVGILGAALYDPVWITAVHTGSDAMIAIIGLVLLEKRKTPPIAVVILCIALSCFTAFV